MNIPTGGRGKKAPYETTTVRVPIPLAEEIYELINQYREFVVNGNLPAAKPIVSYDQAMIQAKEILKQKKSARQSLEKLLQVLYGCETSLKD